MGVAENVSKVRKLINDACATASRNPESVTIVGVTKYVDTLVADELKSKGVNNLGENRPNVFLEKYGELGDGVIWHFIGTLQTRKVRDVINKIDYLHSLDRVSLAEEINKRAENIVKCFVQVNVSGEESKHGIAVDEAVDFIKGLEKFQKIKVIGLMTMAPETEDDSIIRSCFSGLRKLQESIQEMSLAHAPCTELSMGMTDDFLIAINEGATFIRLGRCLVEEM